MQLSEPLYPPNSVNLEKKLEQLKIDLSKNSGNEMADNEKDCRKEKAPIEAKRAIEAQIPDVSSYALSELL